jgi:hypothetical protein
MFKFLKNLIAGILGFITGLLPGKKKNSSYYLELKEDANQSQPAATNGATPTPPVAVTVEPTPASAAKNAKNGKAEKTKAKPETVETTFAPKYLIPGVSSSNGRRYPGANMSAYLDLARQIKTPG